MSNGAIEVRARAGLARRWCSLPLLGVLGCLTAVAGCAAENVRRGQDDLKQLQAALPGTYVSRGNGEQWSITPEDALAVGDPVFFVLQSAIDNPRLVIAQRLWTFQVDAMGRIIQHEWMFRDARRWAGAGEHPDMLLSMLPEDLRELTGCELIWQRVGRVGSEFSAAAATPAACRPGTAAQGQWIEQSAHIQGMQLSLSERRAAQDGTLQGGTPLALTLTRNAGAQP